VIEPHARPTEQVGVAHAVTVPAMRMSGSLDARAI
jgi:hypothetical protein